MKELKKRNLGLYREGLLQSKVIGMPIVCLGAVLLIFDVVNQLFTRGYATRGLGSSVMIVVSAIALPVMLLMLFNFLNSRKASDFYHSQPCSRRSLYLSFGSAALTWSLVPTLALAVVEILIFLLFGIQIDWVSWFNVVCAAVSMNILIAGGVLLAISISSTVFSQVIISGLILFLPSVLLASFEETVLDIVPILPAFEQSVGIIGSMKSNIIISLFFGTISNNTVWQSALFSAVIGAVYAAAGMFLFERRKSEKAALPALNRWVQMAIRVIIAFVICLLPTTELAKGLNKGTPYGYLDEPELMFVFYGVAVIAYFVYEAISIRSIRSIGKSWRELLIGLAVLLVLNLGFIFGAGFAADAALSFQPEKDEVVSVSFPLEGGYTSYRELCISETELTDENVKGMLVTMLDQNIEDIGFLNSSGNCYNDTNYYESTILVQFTMENGREVQRYVHMTPTASERLDNMLMQNSDYCEAVRKTPEDCEVYLNGFDDNRISQEQMKELYEIYRNELAAMDIADILKDEIYVIEYLNVMGRENGVHYDSSYPINLDTPETLKAYISMTASDKKFSQIVPMLSSEVSYNIGVSGMNFDNGGTHYEMVSHSFDSFLYEEFTSTVPTTPTTASYMISDGQVFMDKPIYEEYGFLSVAEFREKLIAELIANEDKPVDITRPFYIVYVDVERVIETEDIQNGSYTYSAYDTYEFFIQAAEEDSCLEMPEFTAGALSMYQAA